MDIISVGTFWTIWLLVHLLFAVALLGALTHQAMAVALPVRRAAGGIVTRYRAVPAPPAMPRRCACCGCSRSSWARTSTPSIASSCEFRSSSPATTRPQGFFDFKEHVATLGLVLLPGYWYLWKNAQKPEYDTARKMVTLVLAVMCWFLFIVGHVLNNTRGFGS